MYRKSIKYFLSLLLSGLVCAGTLALAAEPSATETDQKDKKKEAVSLDDVVVQGEAVRESIQATSATVLSNEQIVDRIYVTPMDMLKLTPGISMSQYRQGGVVPAVQMRGFPYVGHSRDGAISLNGAPLNTLDNADTNVIIPMEVQSVDVVKGPSSPFYGNFNSAGSVAFTTYQSGDFTRGKLSYGSFNTQDAVAVIARRDGNLDQVYAGEVYHTDGYQNNSDWDKQIAAGRWTYHFSDRFQAGAGVRFYNSDWDAPGYIPQSYYDENPKKAVSDVNGGWREWSLVDAHIDYAFDKQSQVSLLAWYTEEDWMRWQQNWLSPAQKPGSNYGTAYRRPRDAFGANLRYQYKGQVLDRDTTLALGVSWQREHQLYEYWNMVVGWGRKLGSKTQDYDLTVKTTAFYGQFDYRILKPLRLVLGARYDMLDGSLEDKLNGGKTDDRDGPNIFSPKIGLVFDMFKNWELFANYAKGFELPGGTTFVQRSYLDPAIRTQYEAGVRVKPSDWSSFYLSAWRMDTTDDFLPTLDDPNVYENAGETRREGIEFASDFVFLKFLRLHLDYAYLTTEYLNYTSGGVTYDGNELPNVPHNILNAEVAWEPTVGLGGRVSLRYQSDWYIATDNQIEADAFEVVNAQVFYKFNKRYKLALDVINVFDKKYSEYLGYTNGELTYAPADPLSFYLTLTIDW